VSTASSHWRSRLPQALVDGRGLWVEGHDDLDASWWPGVLPWQPLRDEIDPPPSWQLLVLCGLTVDMFTSSARTPRLLAAATRAVAENRPILASTPQSMVELKRAVVGDVAPDPFVLDLNGLLAGEELLYLLSARCETSMDAETSSRSGALYLTPIERPLAEALEAEGIPWKAQVSLGSYRADFLVDDRLVVEADGARWHDSEVDQARDQVLQGLGYPTLRLTGRAIVGDLEGCIRRIKEALARTTVHRWDYVPLTPAQTQARDHIDGPAMVVAPAGSGKTRVVVERIKRLVELGAEPSRICAISFTNAAVDEMANRLDERLQEVRTTTLHRLANDIRRGAGLTGQVIGDGGSAAPGLPTRWKILQAILRSSEFRGTHAAGRLWVENIADYRTRLEVPDLESLPLEGTPDVQRARFLEVHRRYEQELRRRNVTDFDGLILDATRILAEDRVQRLTWSSKFDHVIVDEYQDLPPAKLALLRLIASPARNLVAVGDDDQIIYGFAGASPKGFLELERAWRDVRPLPLDRNFRSPHDLVVRTGWLISRNGNRVDKNITADRPLSLDASVTVLTDDAYEKRALEFVRDQLSRGIEPGQIALLFRLSSLAAPVEAALDAAGISYTPLARGSLAHDPTVQWVRAWLRVVGETATPDDYRDTLRRPTRYLSRATIDHLLAGDVERTLRAAIEEPASVPRKNDTQGDDLLRDALVGYLATIHGARAVGPSPSTVLQALKLESALDAQQRDDDKKTAQPRRTTDPAVMIRVVTRLAASATTIEELEAWFEDRDDPDVAAARELSSEYQPDPTGRVVLTTVHKAKGREWPSVAVLGPANAMPDPRADTPDAVEEERRIAYVAATRAQERLLFCASSIYAAELSRAPSGMDWDTYYATATGQLAAEAIPPTFAANETPTVAATEARPASLLEAVRGLWRRLVG
jgi:DNA helicase-2/ATP-dependent DNA helicase PcrA